MSGAEIPAAMAAMEGAAAAGGAAGGAGALGAGAGAGAAAAGAGAGLGAAELGAFGALEGAGGLGALEAGAMGLAPEIAAAQAAGGLLGTEALSPLATEAMTGMGGLEGLQSVAYNPELASEAMKGASDVYNAAVGANAEFAPGMFQDGMIAQQPGFWQKFTNAMSDPKNIGQLGKMAQGQQQPKQQGGRMPMASGAGTESRGQTKPFAQMAPYQGQQFQGFQPTNMAMRRKLMQQQGLLG